MSSKNLFILDTFVLLGFGLPMLINPQFLADLYLKDTTPLSPTFTFIFRLYSIFLISNGILAYLMRNAKSSIGRQAFVISIAVAGLGTSILHIIAFSQGLEKSTGWLTVLVTAILGIWAILILVKEKGIALE
jgi:hypothetical protein